MLHQHEHHCEPSSQTEAHSREGRYQRFEKAFLLAVDIGARDLFMDIHYLALDMGELALAEVARRRADDTDVESVCSGVELLGPLDRGDMLNEGFAGSALTPEGGNPFPDPLSSSGSTPKHTIQQKIPNGPSSRTLKMLVLSEWFTLVWCND